MPYDSQNFNLEDLDIIEDGALTSTNRCNNSPDLNTTEYKYRIKTKLADDSDNWENCDAELLNDRLLTLYSNEIDFDLYQFNEDINEWEYAGNPSPYSLIEDLDELSNSLPHRQLLPQLSGDVEDEMIFKLATTGERDLLHEINHLEARERASRILDNLHDCGAWNTTEVDDCLENITVCNTYLPASELENELDLAELFEDENIFKDITI